MLYQNAASLEYMGDLLSTRYDAHVQDGLLQVRRVWGGRVLCTGGQGLSMQNLHKWLPGFKALSLPRSSPGAAA